MTGTACDLCEYDEKENSCLSNFDLLSLWLFEKINSDHFRIEDSLGYESIFKGNESTRSNLAMIDDGINGGEGL